MLGFLLILALLARENRFSLERRADLSTINVDLKGELFSPSKQLSQTPPVVVVVTSNDTNNGEDKLTSDNNDEIQISHLNAHYEWKRKQNVRRKRAYEDL